MAAGVHGYSAAKGRQFRPALPQDDSNDSDDRRQYSGPVLFQRYTAQTRDTVESNEQSIDSNVENAASQIHPNELRDCQEEDEKEVIKASKESRTQITCLLFSLAILLSFSTSTYIPANPQSTKIWRRLDNFLPKISEGFRRSTKISDDSRRLPKISRRLPKITEGVEGFLTTSKPDSPTVFRRKKIEFLFNRFLSDYTHYSVLSVGRGRETCLNA